VACFVLLQLTYMVLDGIRHVFVPFCSQTCSRIRAPTVCHNFRGSVRDGFYASSIVARRGERQNLRSIEAVKQLHLYPNHEAVAMAAMMSESSINSSAELSACGFCTTLLATFVIAFSKIFRTNRAFPNLESRF
jgi:hypothetical protein